MSIFARFAGSSSTTALQTATEGLADPLAQVDAGFDQERKQRDAEGTTGEGMTEGATQAEDDTNRPTVDLPDGEFGDDPKPEGDTDVVVDADDTEAVFDDLMESEMSLYSLASELSTLSDSSLAIEKFGMDKPTMAIMQITGLLSGTALESLGLESVTASAGTDPEAQMAIEALGEKIKEKAASFAAKVLHIVKDGAGKVMGVLNPLWTKITDLTKSLTSKAWDATKAAGATIKAHPYQTIAAVVTAIAVVGGIVLFMGGAPAMGAKADVVKSFVTKIAGDINSKIKWPFGKLSAKVAPETLRLTFDGGNTAEGFIATPELAKKLGWTQSAVKAVESQAGRAWSAIKGGADAMGARAVKVGAEGVKGAWNYGMKPAMAAGTAAGNSVAATVAKTGLSEGKQAFVTGAATGLAQNGYILMLTSLVVSLSKLIRVVVVGGFKAIISTFRALTGMTSGGEPAAA